MIDEPALAQLLDRARSCTEDGKHLHAVQLYRRITELAPSLDLAWIELAEVYSKLKHYDAAENALLEARARTSDRHEITFLLGNLNLKRHAYGRALLFYRELLEIERALPTRMRTHLSFNAGLVYFYRHNYRLAEEFFRKVLLLDPRFPKIHESLGELLLRRNAVAEAITILQRALVHDPYSWIGHHLLGIAYMRTYDWRNAYEEFVTAIEMDSHESTTWQLCGEVLITLQQLDEAEQYLRKALELNPRFTDAVANFGALYHKRGDHQRALEYFEKALALDPQHRKALQGKAELIVSTKRRS